MTASHPSGRVEGTVSPPPDARVRLCILGPLQILRNGVALDPGPRQQRLVLAVLLAAAGRSVGVGELTELIWNDDAPPSAVNIIQKHVGALRRLLEPEAAERGASSYLRRDGNGYAFVGDPDVLDLFAFREHLKAATVKPDDGRAAALDHYVAALDLWRGPAGGDLRDGSAAKSRFAALDEEFFAACEVAADLAVALHQPQRVLAPLRLAGSLAPLNEAVQAGLVVTLGAAGERAEALALVGRTRSRLSDQLGIDPGPALQSAHQRVLGGVGSSPAAPGTGPGRAGNGSLVGRAGELAVLRRVMESAFAGDSGLVIVEGEPGVGKTRLLEELGAEAESRGALVIWGHCLQGDGAPSMWPWVEVLSAILARLPGTADQNELAGELGRLVSPDDDARRPPPQPAGGAQFRLFEQAAAVVTRAAARQRLVLVLDDLHWADVASLHLFGHLAGRLPTGAVLIGALRTHAPTPGSELTRVLAVASRTPSHRRLHLGPLGPAEVTELFRREAGRTPTAEVARDIYSRTAGNPFFVQELSRLLTAAGDAPTEEAALRTGVPSTVRDVVRDRMTGLNDDARSLLRIAALVGREIDVEMLARAAGMDVHASLGHLEPVQGLGLLGPVPGDPFSVRFTHDLVRQSIAETTPRWQVPRVHLRIADALERVDADVDSIAERLAYHLWAAGPLADPDRTTRALVRAGSSAMAKSALEAAERQLRAAVRVAAKAGLAELELAALSQLTMVLGMQDGYIGAPSDVLERAEQVAGELGREREATSFLFTRFSGFAEGADIARSGPLARRLRERGETSDDAVVRVYGLLSWGMHEWESGNIGEAYRYLSRCTRAMTTDRVLREDLPLLRDLRLLAAGMHGLMTTLHGDVAQARALFEAMESDAGEDRYAITFWASFAVIAAAVTGDPGWASHAAERSIAADPDLSFAFLGTYPRMARWWARGMIGADPETADTNLERMIATSLLDPPRSSFSTWLAALADLRLTLGRTEAAAEALDRAEQTMRSHGERHSEGLLLLLRARVLLARGADVEVVRATAEKARRLSTDREAHLFARAAESFLGELTGPAG